MHDRANGAGWRRRHVLAATLGLAAPAIVGRAQAASGGQVVVGTWGGDYAHLLHDNVDVPLIQPQGIEVVQDIGDEAPRVAKMYAQRRLVNGALDISCNQAPVAYKVADSGLLEPLDETKVPNLAHMRSNLRTRFYAPHIFSELVFIYNPARVSDPPTTFRDLLDAKYNGRIGFPSPSYLYVMMAASLAETGGVTDFEKVKPVMEQLYHNGLKLFAETDPLAAAISSGEIDIGLIWQARVSMWQNAGVPVKAIFPTEGCVLYVSGMSVPKNAPNKANAFKYLNAMLDPSAQQAFAARMGYLATVDNAPLSGKTAEQLKLPDPPPKTVTPDYEYTNRIQNDYNEWWAKLTAKS